MASSAGWTVSRARSEVASRREGPAAASALIALGLLAGCAGAEAEHALDAHLPYYTSAELSAEWLEPGSPEAARAHRIDEFDFIDQDGAHVTRDTLAGHVYVANFIFTSCTSVCPRMSTTFVRVQDAFESDPRVHLVSHTVDPEHDTPERLHHYASLFGAISGRWHFVHGERDALYQLARRSYFAEREPGLSRDGTQFMHTENVLLIDAEGHVRGVYEGTLLAEADRMIEDIRRLEREMDER